MRSRRFRVNHNVTCYGYTVEIRRGGKFSVEQDKANEIPLKYWNPLQKGESIEAGGKVYTPDMVLGPARKGLKSHTVRTVVRRYRWKNMQKNRIC